MTYINNMSEKGTLMVVIAEKTALCAFKVRKYSHGPNFSGVKLVASNLRLSGLNGSFILNSPTWI